VLSSWITHPLRAVKNAMYHAAELIQWVIRVTSTEGRCRFIGGVCFQPPLDVKALIRLIRRLDRLRITSSRRLIFDQDGRYHELSERSRTSRSQTVLVEPGMVDMLSVRTLKNWQQIIFPTTVIKYIVFQHLSFVITEAHHFIVGLHTGKFLHRNSTAGRLNRRYI
jgi:hypothetical protein